MRRIALGFACNNACIFCAQGELRAGSGAQADRDRISALIAATQPGETVALMGGEPTLHEELPRWIREADARGAARILVQTNGRRLAYEAYTRALRDASPRLSLDVSLHGSTEPMHDYHTGAPGSFRQTLLGLRNARAAGIEAAVTTVITRSNFRHLHEIVAVCHGLSARAVRFAVAEPYGSAARSADRVVPAWELVKPYLLAAVTEARRLQLGVVIGENASPAGANDRFAGLGEVEAAARPAPRRPASLAVYGRPAPARNEVRAQARKTGDDLRTIFPTLFEAAGGAG
jgi:MoaA/NifB/PqqE/SkfB family radical SAM enzyme